MDASSFCRGLDFEDARFKHEECKMSSMQWTRFVGTSYLTPGPDNCSLCCLSLLSLSAVFLSLSLSFSLSLSLSLSLFLSLSLSLCLCAAVYAIIIYYPLSCRSTHVLMPWLILYAICILLEKHSLLCIDHSSGKGKGFGRLPVAVSMHSQQLSWHPRQPQKLLLLAWDFQGNFGIGERRHMLVQ